MERIVALEAALTRFERHDLRDAAALIRNLAERLHLVGADDSERIRRIVTQALADIRDCLKDKRRSVDSAWVQEAESALLVLTPPDALTQRPGSPEEMWAGSMLSSLASADDAELAMLTDAALANKKVVSVHDELGTLREPLSAAKPAGRVLMKGELHTGLLADLIQLFAQNAETGELTVETPAMKGSVFFKDGTIVDATAGETFGEKAFFYVMQAREGRFSYLRGVVSPETRIYRSAQHLIMDTLRIMDESA